SAHESFSKDRSQPISIAPLKIDALQSEVNFVNDFMHQSTNLQNVNTSKRWTFIFRDAKEKGINLENIETIICHILTLSPSNCVPETMFSEINNYWRDSKSNIDFLSIFSFIIIRFNLKTSFEDFCKATLANDDLLQEIRSANKY